MARPLIMGIGNILMSDEGVGVRAIEAMRDMDLGDDFDLLDGGTSGADLIDEIADRPKLVVIDAVKAGAEPGTVFQFTAADMLRGDQASISLHEFGLAETLLMAGKLGCSPKEVMIFGIQPKVVGPGLELSEEVRRVLPKVIELATEEARRTRW